MTIPIGATLELSDETLTRERRSYGDAWMYSRSDGKRECLSGREAELADRLWVALPKESRSQLRRIAAMRGEPLPDFSGVVKSQSSECTEPKP